jgi:hypothetical protein
MECDKIANLEKYVHYHTIEVFSWNQFKNDV